MKRVACRFESCSLAEAGAGLGWFDSNTEKSALVSNDSHLLINIDHFHQLGKMVKEEEWIND